MAAADVEAVDFEPEDDDLMDEEGAMEVEAPAPRLRSTITGGRPSASTAFPSMEPPKKTKGRGFRDEELSDRVGRMAAKEGFESLDSDGGPGPQRCELFSFFLLRPSGV